MLPDGIINLSNRAVKSSCFGSNQVALNLLDCRMTEEELVYYFAQIKVSVGFSNFQLIEVMQSNDYQKLLIFSVLTYCQYYLAGIVVRSSLDQVLR